MTSSAYPSTSLTSYPTTVLDPLLQASSLASAASVQTTSGETAFSDTTKQRNAENYICKLN